MAEKAKLTIFRYDQSMKSPRYHTYEVPKEKGLTVLQALFVIKDDYDDPPAFRRYQCNKGLCCSCLMVIDSEIKRACTTEVLDEMIIEPLHDYPVIRDLIVDFGELSDGMLIRKGTLIQWPKTKWMIDRGVISQIIYDSEKCTGCQSCQEVCPVNSFQDLNGKYGERKLFPVLFQIENEKVILKGVCSQCSNAPCMYYCPAKVITRDEETGAIFIDKRYCMGCGMCVVACPNDAVFLDMGRGKAIKCELCEGKPQCVEACPSGALKFVSRMLTT